MTAPSVLAVVVAYENNQSLSRCLRAIAGQTFPVACAVVVDNGRVERAEDAIDGVALTVDVVRTGVNGGPGGGFAAGLTRFVEGAWDHAWVMDDDCEPEPDALETQLGAVSPTTIVVPVRVHPDGREEHKPAWCGVLLPRDVVEAVGVPRADFVWWMEDTEYLHWRIPKAGFGVVESTARVFSDFPRRVDRKPAWKYYYEARNGVYYRLYVNRTRFLRWMALRLFVLPFVVLVRETERLHKLWMYERGIVDGVRKRLGLRVPLG